MAVRVLSAPLFMAMVALPLAATGQVESDDATVRVGISQFVTHPALDAVREGIIDELAERGWDDIEYDVQNANADIATSRQIATKFRSDGVDVAIGIARREPPSSTPRSPTPSRRASPPPSPKGSRESPASRTGHRFSSRSSL